MSCCFPRLLSICLVLLFAAACADPAATRQQAFERGNAYLAEGKRKEAIIEFQNALQADPKFGDARLKLAETYEASGDVPRAFREYVRAADLLPDNERAQLHAGRYLVAAGQFEDARSRAQKVLDKNPGQVDALNILGRALAGLKDVSGAITQIQEAIELDPSRPASYANLAALELAEGRTAEAETALKKAVDAAPSAIMPHLTLGYFYWSTGRAADAERLYKQALELDPKHMEANRALVAFYMSANRRAEAEPFVKTLADVTGTSQARLNLADYYLTTGRLDDAAKVLRELAGDETVSSGAQTRLAQIDYGQKRITDAHATIDAVLKQEPANVPALLTKARWLLREQKPPEALAQAELAARSDPRSLQAHYLLGQIHESRRDLDAATKSYSKVLELNPRATLAQLQLSRLQLARGSADASVLFAQDAVKNAPNSPDARAMLTRGLIRQGQFQKAESEIAALGKQYAQNPVVLALNGHLHAAKGDLPAAERAFAQALEQSPDYIEAVVGLATVQLSQKKLPEARQLVESHTAKTNDPALTMAAARVYVAGRDLPRAEAMLRRTIEQSPSLLPAYNLLGHVYVAQGKLDQAKLEFEALATRQPTSPMPPTIIGMILEMQKNPNEARKHYAKAIELDPRAAVAANNLAALYSDAGENLKEALALAQRASEEIPGSPDVQDTLGWVYYKMELPTLAIPPFERSVEQDPRNPMRRYRLGLAFEKSGQIDDARRAFQEALKLKPDFAEVKKALESLKG